MGFLIVCGIVVIVGVAAAEEPVPAVAHVGVVQLSSPFDESKQDEVTEDTHVLAPVATVSSGQWRDVAAWDTYDIHRPEEFAGKPAPWDSWIGHIFSDPYEPGATFATGALTIYWGYDVRLRGLTGKLSRERRMEPAFEEPRLDRLREKGWFLVTDRPEGVLPPRHVDTVPMRDAIAQACRSAIDGFVCQTIEDKRSIVLGEDGLLPNEVEVKEALELPLSEGPPVVWVHAIAPVPATFDDQAVETWDCAVLLRKIEGEYRHVWQDTTPEGVDVQAGFTYDFVGHCDADGDGNPEVLLWRNAWELWEYYLVEVEGGKAIVRARAAQQGL